MIAEPSLATPHVESLRAHFPTLQAGFAYLENAGGSQVPRSVPDAMHEYMLSSYVQLGAGYAQSIKATKTVEEAHAFANTLMGGDGIGQTLLAQSTTALLHILANSYATAWEGRGERAKVVVAESGHEANIGPWANLQKRGHELLIWKFDTQTLQCPLDALEELLKGGDIKIVAFPHVSNLLGEIVDIKATIELAHRYGACVVVDGVAFAPHRPVDVAAFGADWYVFSCYKVFAPHMAALFGTFDAFAEIEGPNHFFIPRESPYKFELGGVPHELCAGLLGLRPYLAAVAGEEGERVSRQTIVRAFENMAALEIPLQRRFIEYLNSKPSLRIVGPSHGEPSRVCTISFVHERLSPPEIVESVHKHPIGIRYGNAYAYRLCQALGLDPATAVVRASFAHYNTLEEVERLIGVLEEVV